MSKTAVTITAN